MKPTVGRIVHYVLSEEDTACVSSIGRHRPAIIVEPWGNEKHDASEAGSCVNLQVFTDGRNDALPPMYWKTSVVYSEAKTQGTWHWPERDEA